MDGAVNVLRVDAKAGIEYYCGMSALDLCGFDGVFLWYVVFLFGQVWVLLYVWDPDLCF